MSLPTDNINICILGRGDCGKSTIVDSIFGSDYLQSKLKNNVIIPIVLVENKKNFQTNKVINDKISEFNKNFDNFPTYCPELIFNVKKSDITIDDNFNLAIFDIPGLDNSVNKKVSYSYLKKNFPIFDIVIFVYDIKKGFDEIIDIQIINFIVENIKINKLSKKDTKMLVIANKADEMKLNYETDKLEFVNNQLNNNFVKNYNIIEQIFTTWNIKSNLIGTIPLCATDAKLFRGIKLNKTDKELTSSQIQKIGIYQMGYRFRQKTILEQKQIINNLLSDENFINDSIKLSGFTNFESILIKTIKKDCLSNYYFI